MIAQIAGTGFYVPERRVTNQDLAVSVHLDDAGIQKRTGIQERRWVRKNQAASDLATEAVRAALEQAGCEAMDLEAIILATTSPDMWFPSTACLVQKNLHAPNAFAMDVSASCSGFLFALSVAEQFIRSGRAKTVAAVAAEVKSRFLNRSDPATAILFGDGAGAVVLKPSEGESGLLSIRLYSDGSRSGMIQIPAGGSRRPISKRSLAEEQHVIRMKGGSLFKAAVQRLTAVTHEILKSHRLQPSDIHHFVFHQANTRILSAVAKRLCISRDRLVMTLDRYGNTSSASLPMALDHLIRSRRVRPGDWIYLGAFGGGLNWGGALVRW
ncbi:MAG TPA: beta-ketoacyl-ACP synthase III [Nitrospiria bacterium]|nr:beta-ketoacyl-ACP synthase III [Nitrospiria bacterium]